MKTSDIREESNLVKLYTLAILLDVPLVPDVGAAFLEIMNTLIAALAEGSSKGILSMIVIYVERFNIKL